MATLICLHIRRILFPTKTIRNLSRFLPGFGLRVTLTMNSNDGRQPDKW